MQVHVFYRIFSEFSLIILLVNEFEEAEEEDVPAMFSFDGPIGSGKLVAKVEKSSWSKVLRP